MENQTCEGRKETKTANVGRKEKTANVDAERGAGASGWGTGGPSYSRMGRLTAGWLGYGITIPYPG